jgi:hypothetical protein
LLLLLLYLLLGALDGWGARLLKSGPGSRGRGALLFKSGSLQMLEFGQGSLEFLVQFALGVLLRRLWLC